MSASSLVMVSVIALRVSFSGFVKVYKLQQKSRICYRTKHKRSHNRSPILTTTASPVYSALLIWASISKYVSVSTRAFASPYANQVSLISTVSKVSGSYRVTRRAWGRIPVTELKRRRIACTDTRKRHHGDERFFTLYAIIAGREKSF